MNSEVNLPILPRRASGDLKYVEEEPDGSFFCFPVIRWAAKTWPTDISEYLAGYTDESAHEDVKRIRRWNYAKAMILDLLSRCAWSPAQWLTQREIAGFTGLSVDTVQDVMLKCTEPGYRLVFVKGYYISKNGQRYLARVYRISMKGVHWLEKAREKQVLGTDPRFKISVLEVGAANREIYFDAHKAIMADRERDIAQQRENIIIERMAAIMPEPGQEDGPGTLFYQGGYGP